MTAKTKIQWTDETWNPVRGCAIVSPGCVNCYAMTQAHRFSGAGQPYEGLTKLTSAGPQWTGQVRTVAEALRQPFRWRKPHRIFVNSMSDLFHDDVPEAFLDQVFAVMAFTGQHTYQILTKRPARMREYLTQRAKSATPWKQAARTLGCALEFEGRSLVPFPLPNVWLGVSCEDQQRADARIPLLLETPAVVRFVSAEPLLGPINLNPFLTEVEPPSPPILDWVIVGGESGPGSRPCEIGWVQDLLDQCLFAGVACFVKQLGARPVLGFEQARSGEVWRVTAASGGTEVVLKDRKGGDMSEWPERLRVREFPS